MSRTKTDREHQIRQEIVGTLLVVLCSCAWHIVTAFVLNGRGWYFLGVPAWLSVSVLGAVVILFVGLWYLLGHVFADFDYDEPDGIGPGEEK